MNGYQFKTISNIDGVLKLELLGCSKVILPGCDCIIDDLTDEQKTLLSRGGTMQIIGNEKVIEPDLTNIDEEIKGLIKEKEASMISKNIEKTEEINKTLSDISNIIEKSDTIGKEDKSKIVDLLSTNGSGITDSVKH